MGELPASRLPREPNNSDVFKFAAGIPIIVRPEIDCAALSDSGKWQLANRDAQLVLRLTERQLLAVADGVGREAAGLCASRLVLETLRQVAEEHLSDGPRDRDPRHSDDLPTKTSAGRDLLQELIPLCQLRLRQEAELHPDLAPMGTTLTVALIDWPEMEVLHVGDSRCYLLRPARLECLTTAHTVAEKMVEAGILPKEDMAVSRWRNVLWNAVSSSDHIALADRSRVRLSWGDSVLLCTDGLTKQLGDQQIGQILREERGAADQCRRLVDVAKERGGADNTTVIVVRVLPAGRDRDRDELDTPLRQRGSDSPRGHYSAN